MQCFCNSRCKFVILTDKHGRDKMVVYRLCLNIYILEPNNGAKNWFYDWTGTKIVCFITQKPLCSKVFPINIGGLKLDIGHLMALVLRIQVIKMFMEPLNCKPSTPNARYHAYSVPELHVNKSKYPVKH